MFATQGAERDVQVYVGEQIDSRAAILWAVLRSTLWPMLAGAAAAGAGGLVGGAPAAWRRCAGSARTLAERQPQALHPVVA